MATSRTGTAKYLRNRRTVLSRAKREGLTHCPGYDGHPCGTELDYRTRAEFLRDEPHRAGQFRPNAAVTDHVIAAAQGGSDDVENLAVICAECNLKKGDGDRVPVEVASVSEFPLSREW